MRKVSVTQSPALDAFDDVLEGGSKPDKLFGGLRLIVFGVKRVMTCCAAIKELIISSVVRVMTHSMLERAPMFSKAKVELIY